MDAVEVRKRPMMDFLNEKRHRNDSFRRLWIQTTKSGLVKRQIVRDDDTSRVDARLDMYMQDGISNTSMP